MEQFVSARAVVNAWRPDVPVYCFRPSVLAADAQSFKAAFPGRTAYAVKTNGEPLVLETLAKAGIDCFDVASPGEFAAVRAVAPKAEMLYMHPVKAQSDIRLALETYRIRELSLDHEDEVTKIIRIVRGLDLDPEEITLFVRLATRGNAAYELSRKFGAAPGQAVELADRIHRSGFKVGLCFHVGSQVEDTDTYERALATAAWVRSRTNAPIAALDIGGGFPAAYGTDPRKPVSVPDTQALLAEVVREANEWGFGDVPLTAEPGRVIVARCLSVIVRVLLRKGKRLYINDGIWASLSDSWTGKITLPARFLPDSARRARRSGNPDKLMAFRVCGATCDSVDILSRPFYLPETIDTGDWIEIGHIGAYSLSLRTRFNGFYPDTFAEVTTPFEAAGPAESFAAIETMGDGVPSGE